MFRTSRIATTVLAAAGAAIAASSPALADPGQDIGGGTNPAGNWDFTAASVCFQELAVVPVAGDWVSDHVNHCTDGNVIGHPLD